VGLKKQSSGKKKAKKQGQKKLGKKTQKVIIKTFWIGVLSSLLLTIIMLVIAGLDDMPSFEELENPKSNLATEVYSADGQVLGRYFRENRVNVGYNDLSPHLVKALIATEDERFYEHSGIDLRALGRVVKGVVTGNSSQGGGSTISQQLAKLLFPRENPSGFGMVKRKLKEWIIAVKLERRYTKEEILTMYLNKFDFINQAVGIKSASEVYFKSSPASLELHEAALLIGMLKNPSLYNPRRFEEKTIGRRATVFGQMYKNDLITESEKDSLNSLDLGLRFSKVDHNEGIAPYFREILRKEVSDLLAKKDKNDDYKYQKPNGDKYNIYRDGLKIYTTIDSRMQRYAEYAVKQHLGKELQKDFFKDLKRKKNPPFSNDVSKEQRERSYRLAMKNTSRYKKLIKTLSDKEVRKNFDTPVKMRVFTWDTKSLEKDTTMSPMDSIKYYKSFLRSGLMSMDPHTGFVKAWVGSQDFRHFKYDMVKKGKRQVGSTFKPFVYATAIRDGAYQPCDEILNIKHCIELPHTAEKNKKWCPENADGKYDGLPTPLTYALANSMNSITAAIMKDVKPANVAQLASDLGIQVPEHAVVPALALGICDLSIYQMVGAMSAFANKGIYIEPIIITRIEDKNGNVIYDVEPTTREALSEQDAYAMLEMMKGTKSGVKHPHKPRGDRTRWMGSAMRLNGSRPYADIRTSVACKTGTTQNQSDGWFMGITPDLVTGVWTGAEDRGVRFSRLRLGMGTNTALPIWGYYMNKVYDNKSLKVSKGDFEKPAGELKYQTDCDKKSNERIPEEEDPFGDEELF